MRTVVNFKKSSDDAIAPCKSRPEDAGYDLYASEAKTLQPGDSAVISTGIAVALPSFSVGLIWPRSGLSVKHCLETGAGVIDSNYRGVVAVKLYNFGSEAYEISKGDRIAQLLVMPKLCVDFIEGDLGETDRGDQGFGSSGV